MATAYLLRRLVETFKITDLSGLIGRVQQAGKILIAAQPREVAIGNIVRRVLGVIREEADEDRDGETSGHNHADTDSRPQSVDENRSRASDAPRVAPLRQGASDQPSLEIYEGGTSQHPSLLTAYAPHANANTGPQVTSMFSLLSHPRSYIASPTATTGSQSPRPPSNKALANLTAAKDLRAEIVEGIQEILEELNQADDQIAGYSLDYIHSNETILTYTSSITIQKFLLKAAAKRKFTVIQAEAFSDETVIGQAKRERDDELSPESFQKSLTAAGITVILIPDSAVYALMSRVNKVILDTHIILANGGVVVAAGARGIAKAASMHRTPVIMLGAIYKLSPVYPFDIDSFLEIGDPGGVISYGDGDMVDMVEHENPLFDYIPQDLVDLYITNL